MLGSIARQFWSGARTIAKRGILAALELKVCQGLVQLCLGIRHLLLQPANLILGLGQIRCATAARLRETCVMRG